MTSKSRNMLNNFAKEREEFERQKRELEAQMHQGKQNLGHIRKGMRTNEISHLKEVETDEHTIHPSRSHDKHDSGHKDSKRKSSVHNMGRSQQSLHSHGAGHHTHASSAYPSSHPSQPTDLTKSASFTGIYMPPGRRVSDWFFTSEDPHSRPVGVKSQDVYQTVRFLGRGAFGSVDLVKHCDDHRLYAQKTMLLESAGVDEDLLFQEVHSLRVNRHPFIISVSDVYCLVNPRRLYIVLQYCDGGDLQKAIAVNQKSNTHFPESQILKWMAQIALALHYLQQHHYLHRDIKPANMLLCDNGEIVKLGDFGFAVQIDENNLKSLSTAEVGTPYYTAPEMIRQEPCSFPSDNWSFGIMLYETLLLGRHPFDGATTADLVRGIMNEDPPEAPSVYSNDLVEIACKLLTKDPAARLTMTQFLTSPVMQNKVASVPNNYKPKYLMEERFRRAQVRQLTQQVEHLGITPRGGHAASHSHLHAHGSSAHIHDAPAPPIGLSRKGSASERGIRASELDSLDDLEETKRKLSVQYGSSEMMSRSDNSATLGSAVGEGILPAINVHVRVGSAEGRERESHSSEHHRSPTHLPALGRPAESPVAKGSPSMPSHLEEAGEFETGEVDAEEEKERSPDLQEDDEPVELFTPREGATTGGPEAQADTATAGGALVDPKEDTPCQGDLGANSIEDSVSKSMSGIIMTETAVVEVLSAEANAIAESETGADANTTVDSASDAEPPSKEASAKVDVIRDKPGSADEDDKILIA